MPVQCLGDAGQPVNQHFQILGEQNDPGFSRIHRGRRAKSSRGNSHFMTSLQRRVFLAALVSRAESGRQDAYTPKPGATQLSEFTGLSISVLPLRRLRGSAFAVRFASSGTED